MKWNTVQSLSVITKCSLTDILSWPFLSLDGSKFSVLLSVIKHISQEQNAQMIHIHFIITKPLCSNSSYSTDYSMHQFQNAISSASKAVKSLTYFPALGSAPVEKELTVCVSPSPDSFWAAGLSSVFESNSFFFRDFRLWDGDHVWENKKNTRSNYPKWPHATCNKFKSGCHLKSKSKE